MTAPPMAYYGGKTRLADRIVSGPHRRCAGGRAGAERTIRRVRTTRAGLPPLRNRLGGSVTAQEVIAAAFSDTEVRCSWTPEGHAQHALDALTAAGYAVVQLPQLNAHGAWPVMWADEPEAVYPLTNGQVRISGFDDTSTENARAFAAALLAAANAAEAETK